MKHSIEVLSMWSGNTKCTLPHITKWNYCGINFLAFNFFLMRRKQSPVSVFKRLSSDVSARRIRQFKQKRFEYL